MKNKKQLVIKSVLILILLFSVSNCQGNSPRAPQVHPPPISTVSPFPSPLVHAIPMQLNIPAINAIHIPIESVGQDKKGQMDIPHVWNESAWYSLGVKPGEFGDAVIDCHLDWIVNGKDTPGPCFHLDNLKVGQQFEITTQTNEELVFTVTYKENLDRNITSSQLLAKGYFDNKSDKFGNKRVTLITCSGDWNPSVHSYTTRLAVTGEYVGI